VTIFNGQKNMIMLIAIQVLLLDYQENLFIKSLCCKKDEAFSCDVFIM